MNLETTVAGVRFRSPIGLAPIGGSSHFGARDPDENRELEGAVEYVLKNVEAGSNHVCVNISYIRPETLRKLLDAYDGVTRPAPPTPRAERFLRVTSGGPPYGLEGLYSAVSPGPCTPDPAVEEGLLAFQARFVEAVKQRRPEGVPIIGAVIGCGGLPDGYVDAARKCEELGVDLVEINFHCPLQAGQRNEVDWALRGWFPAVSHGGLIAEHPALVGQITKAVVNAVSLPVGAKFSAEAGFPRIVELARQVRDAGGRYVHVGGAGVGIAPPDIYNGGRPKWSFMDGNPFCLTSGAWMRRICYRDVAAVARFVPGLDIVASGGLVQPEHCVEAMMLGASVTQVCAGVLEQGRSLLRRANEFLSTFLCSNGYSSVTEIVGLAQQYISHAEDIDMMPGQVVSSVDHDKCTNCGTCLDGLCLAISDEGGEVAVQEERCTGCGACTLVCPSQAFSLRLRG
ncbi:MAG: 4Fe-4S binding protein [Thermoleophilia bacterium]|nr:4Fe-4S binding protein [Thermoleophilia bacterium]